MGPVFLTRYSENVVGSSDGEPGVAGAGAGAKTSFAPCDQTDPGNKGPGRTQACEGPSHCNPNRGASPSGEGGENIETSHQPPDVES